MVALSASLFVAAAWTGSLVDASPLDKRVLLVPSEPLPVHNASSSSSSSSSFVIRATRQDGFAPSRPLNKRGANIVKRCAAPAPSSSSSSAAPTRAPNNVGGGGASALPPTTTSTAPTKTQQSGGGSSSGSNGQAPVGWPSQTQSGPTYSATAASSSDPSLMSISEALNFDGVSQFHQKFSGDLTYYDTGMTACGDYYEDSTYTAAISHLLWTQLPGGQDSTFSRAPVCGPFTTGRQIVNSAGGYSRLRAPQDLGDGVRGEIVLGGDGLPNCMSSITSTLDPAPARCHVPLRARITSGTTGRSVIVSVVDRCEGCAGVGDIDVTPTVFEALEGSLTAGRSSATWEFVYF